MVEIKRVSEDYINNLSAEKGFSSILLLKDYYITALLYLMKDIRGIYFKGGTALNKIFLSYARISEDIDFTITRELEEVNKEIKEKINESKLFETINEDKNVEGFTRLVVHYKGLVGEDGVIFLDLNQRAKLSLKPEEHEIDHFYKEYIPSFSFNTVSKEEIIAEKVSALVGRNKPRDHFDIYQLLKKRMPINIELVKKKCHDSGCEFDIIKIFNQGQKLHRRWQEDIAPLLAEEVSYNEVMQTLAEHFKLKDAKEKLKKK